MFLRPLFFLVLCALGFSDLGLACTRLIAGRTPWMDRLLEERGEIRLASAPNLVLRTPRPEDLSSILPIFADYETVKYTWFKFEKDETRWTMDTLVERFEWQAKHELGGDRFDFVIALKGDTKTVVGRCALYPWKGKGEWEFGITIYREHWGRHYGEEVVRVAKDYVFNQLGGDEFRLRVLDDNAGMIRVCDRLGIPQVLRSEQDTPEKPFFQYYRHYAVRRDSGR